MSRRDPQSLRGLARLLGVDDKAVRKALAAGVFGDAVDRYGGEHHWPKVVNVAAAVAAWKRSGRRVQPPGALPSRASISIGLTVNGQTFTLAMPANEAEAFAASIQRAAIAAALVWQGHAVVETSPLPAAPESAVGALSFRGDVSTAEGVER